MTTATRLTGDAMLNAIQCVIENSNVLNFVPTASVKAKACGYIKADGNPDFIPFYEALIEAKGLDRAEYENENDKWPLYEELAERYGEGAVDAFIEIWSGDDLEYFEDAYQGEYESGAAYAEELVTDCYGIPNSFPCFVAIDWNETWNNLSYDYYFESGFIFNANW